MKSDFSFSELMSAHRRSNSLTRITRVLPGQQLFSVAQAAAILGRSTPTIYRALCAGKINIVRTPLGRRIARGEIERLLGFPLEDAALNSLLVDTAETLRADRLALIKRRE
jgi:excisionase family DNA binding protein